MFYKTWLFVPAIVKYLKDVPRADVIIFDLEDSIRPDDKEAARERLHTWLSNQEGQNTQELYVRINSGQDGLDDLESLHECTYSGVMIPKFEMPEQLSGFLPVLGNKKVCVLIETLAGVIGIDQIAACEEISAIAFGGEDYCRELGVETNDQALQYARGRIVLYSKYYKKNCLDTISLEYKDKSLFREQFENSITMGFDSKLLIHPAQVQVVEAIDDQVDLNKIREIVDRYENSDMGLMYMNGRWYEKPHIERLKMLLRQKEI